MSMRGWMEPRREREGERETGYLQCKPDYNDGQLIWVTSGWALLNCQYWQLAMSLKLTWKRNNIVLYRCTRPTYMNIKSRNIPFLLLCRPTHSVVVEREMIPKWNYVCYVLIFHVLYLYFAILCGLCSNAGVAGEGGTTKREKFNSYSVM